jgi:ABC-type sugar transport system ATPase subunit
MLELENVSTSYGQVQMLRGLSMNVRKGELVCLLGPNGAGKSTTFKALSGLLSLDGGAVRMLGEDVARTGTEGLTALGVGFVPEGRRLFPSLTVRENLKLGYDASRCATPFEDPTGDDPRHVPARAGTHDPARPHHVRGRAGDGGPGPRPDRRPGTADHGRAFAGSVAQADRRIFRHRRPHPRSRDAPSC